MLMEKHVRLEVNIKLILYFSLRIFLQNSGGGNCWEVIRVCICVGGWAWEISIGTIQLMLFYWSLWPEPINTKVKGQQLGNNDSILMMMFVQVCVRILVCLCGRINVRAQCVYQHIHCDVCVYAVFECVCACIWVCTDMCIHAPALV